MKNKGNIWNKVLNIPSAQDPSAFHSDEDAKHKYTMIVMVRKETRKKEINKGNKGRKEKQEQKMQPQKIM